jgi:hypothetical protein
MPADKPRSRSLCAAVARTVLAAASSAMLVLGTVTVITQAAITQSAGAAPVTQTGGFGAIPEEGLDQSRCQGLKVGSHIYFQGQTVVATTSNGICGSAPKDITWTWTVVGNHISGCGKDESTCVFRAGPSTDGQYGVICILGENIQGPWDSCDYFGVVGKDFGVLDGYVLDKSGDPVPGVDITAYGANSANTSGAITGANGYYAMQVHAGAYRLVPGGGPAGHHTIDYLPHVNNTTVGDGTEGRADFQLQAGIQLNLHFDQSQVPANGIDVVNGTITTSEGGKPLPGIMVELQVMPGQPAAEAVTGGPRATVCSQGSRLWPTGTNVDPDGYPVNITTGSNGQYSLAITVGTTPGTWRLEAWAFNSNGTLSLDPAQAADTQSITFEKLNVGPNDPTNFVTEYDRAIKATPAFRLTSSNASPLVATLAQATAAGGGALALRGLAYALVNAKDGQSLLVFPADHPPTLDSVGALPVVTNNAKDLVMDPAEWDPTKGNFDTSVNQGNLGPFPTLVEFDSGRASSQVDQWKLVKGNEITEFNSYFGYLGWGYPGIGQPGACY